MAFWWVNQGKTYKEEKKDSFLWAPNKNKNGKTQHHWETMNEVSDGDIIFSYTNGKIKAFSYVVKSAYDFNKPFSDNNETISWSKDGKKIDLIFNELINPISLNSVFNDLINLLQNKYSPLNSSGKVNQGYLFKVTDAAGRYLLNKIKDIENIDVDEIFDENIKNSEIKETTKLQLSKSRIGQGEFRKDLLKMWNSRCAITQCDITELLIASHTKPWTVSSNKERLDPNNGLLLSATYDKLFDRGLISFDEEGNILISKKLTQQNLKCLSINTKSKLCKKLNETQKSYLDYHRKEVFN